VKECRACHVPKELDEFHRDSASPDGRRPRCKECVSKRSKDLYYADHTASREKAVKHYRENRIRIAKRRSARRYEDIERRRKKERTYYHDHQAKMLEYQKKWRSDPENKVYLRGTKREWNRRNRVRVSVWINQYRMRLRGRRIQVVRAVDVAARISVFGDACAYCGAPWEHLDHVYPIKLGGPHCLANLRPACASCNHRKSAKPWREWMRLVPKPAPLPLPEERMAA
jgi:5-methylcytosine-specific restriction endonuclease McrA